MQRKIIHPGWNLDYLMFLFTRISGLSILALALAGMATAFIMGARTQMDVGALMRWTFFANPNHVISTDIPDVVPNWSNGFWQVMEMLVIFFAGTHGINGLRMVIEDYIAHPLWLTFFRALLFLIWIAGLIIAVYVILAS